MEWLPCVERRSVCVHLMTTVCVVVSGYINRFPPGVVDVIASLCSDLFPVGNLFSCRFASLLFKVWIFTSCYLSY